MNETPPTFSMILTLLRGFYWFEDSVRNYVRSRGWEDFTHSQSMLMTHVMLGYRQPAEIARQLGISRQAIHVTIQQMVKKNIITLTDDPQDRRNKLVYFTKIGDRMRAEALDGMRAIVHDLGGRIGAENVRKAAQILASDWGPALKFDKPKTAARKAAAKPARSLRHALKK